MLTPNDITCTVEEPETQGSGMSRHVVYKVVTKTTLAQYPARDLSVSRRYRDFHWLHGRLTTMFPGTVIPVSWTAFRSLLDLLKNMHF